MEQMRGSRMVAFRAIMLMLVGAINVRDGLVAVNNEPYFKRSERPAPGYAGAGRPVA